MNFKTAANYFTFLGLVAVTIFAPASAMAQTAEYELTFEGQWQAPVSVPAGGHFSRLVGATHNSSGSLFTVGQLASQGIENVAERGNTASLLGEINAGIAAGNINAALLGTDTILSPLGTDTFNFTTSASHSKFSIMTMIAPSPDWLVGVSDLELLDSNGNFRQQIVLDLNNYDAGTENGSGFSLNNSATNPQGLVAALDTAEPTGGLFGSGPIARITLTRISSSVLLGDVNLDGVVDFLDISPFIAILSAGTFQAEADCDENTVVDFLDISPFIAILSDS